MALLSKILLLKYSLKLSIVQKLLQCNKEYALLASGAQARGYAAARVICSIKTSF